MKLPLFILGLIFTSESLFRLFEFGGTPHKFFPLNGIELRTDTYVYFLFEHLKVIGLGTIIFIQDRKCLWVPLLFVVDLMIYMLNYNSTLDYIGVFPIGADVIKMVIFIFIILSYGRKAYIDYVAGDSVNTVHNATHLYQPLENMARTSEEKRYIKTIKR